MSKICWNCLLIVRYCYMKSNFSLLIRLGVQHKALLLLSVNITHYTFVIRSVIFITLLILQGQLG